MTDFADQWDAVRRYKAWLCQSNPYWRRVLKPGDTNPRRTASCCGLQLPQDFDPYFGILNGQKSGKLSAIPFKSTFGFMLFDVEMVECRRSSQLGSAYFHRELPYKKEYFGDSTVRSGVWRKAWFPFAEAHLDFGSHILFVDYDPVAGGSRGQVVLQINVTEFTWGWCQRLVLSESICSFFEGLGAFAKEGLLTQRPSFGVDITDRSDLRVCSYLGLDRARDIPVETGRDG